jgi:hypothetical protein
MARMMARTNSRIVFVLGLILMVVACKEATTRSILNIHNAVIPNGLYAEQVRDSIITVGPRRNWIMREVSRGVIRGELRVRQHRAVIEITYTNSEFNIDYVESANLDAGPDGIHRNYNRWIANLESDIRSELSRVASGN